MDNINYLIISVSNSTVEHALIDACKVCLYFLENLSSNSSFFIGYNIEENRIFIFSILSQECDFIHVLHTKIQSLYELVYTLIPNSLFSLKSEFSVIYENTNIENFELKKQEIINLYHLEIFDINEKIKK